MGMTSGQAVFATDADKVESKTAANALTALGITATVAELNYVDNVTSAIQTQLDAKMAPGGALGTPSSGTLTNCTGLPQSGVTNLTTDLATKAPATPLVNPQTGTTYELVAGDNGKIVTLSNGSAITLTVPAGLGAGFHCQLIQIGAGQVTITGSGVTVNNRQSFTKIAGQYGVAGLTSYATNVFALSGDVAS